MCIHLWIGKNRTLVFEFISAILISDPTFVLMPLEIKQINFSFLKYRRVQFSSYIECDGQYGLESLPEATTGRNMFGLGINMYNVIEHSTLSIKLKAL